MVKKSKKMKNPVEPIPDPVTIKSAGKQIGLEDLRKKEGADAISIFEDNMIKTHVKGFGLYGNITIGTNVRYWVLKNKKSEERVL